MRLILDRPQRRTPTPTETSCLAILGGGAAILGVQQLIHRDLLFCPLHTVTGIPCSFCGGTRAVIALAHGDLPRAVAYNPLALALFAAMVLAAATYLCLVLPLRRRPIVAATRLETRVLQGLLLAAFAANWVYVATAGMYKVPIS